MNYYEMKRLGDIVNFFARSLGPDYQVVLYSVKNGAISNLEYIQNPLDDSYIDSCKKYLNSLIKEKKYLDSSFVFHYYGLTSNNHSIRSSSYFIEDEHKELCAVLNVDFDQQRYRALSKEIYHLCHPDAFVESEPLFFEEVKHSAFTMDTNAAYTRGSLSSVISEILNLNQGLNISNLSSKERKYLISELDKRGIFKVKGAIKELSEILCCSPSSIYRCIQKK